MNEWLISCRKAFRLFLRRVYVSKKANRDRLLSRPLNDCDAPEDRPRRSCFTNLTLLSVLVVCYFFLTSPPTPKVLSYSEKSIETSVLVNPRQIMRVNIPKEMKVELARKWLTRNNEIKEEGFLTTAPPKSYAELAISVPANVIIIDDNKTSSTTTVAPDFWEPKCDTRVSPEKLSLKLSAIKVSLEDTYPMVKKGGYFKPSGCEPVHKVAILVPYRNRTRNLTTFLFNIHPFLMTQNLEYQIFVIEQFGTNAFNKGRLYNAGFKEMKKFNSWRCVVFHDVDLLPLDRRVFYTCPMFPRHMSSQVLEKSSRNSSSPILFGGVTAMTLDHYERANGHSNMYWGWGGEDYDMFWRLKAARIPVVRYNKTIAKYIALPHPYALKNPNRYSLIRSAIGRWQGEGLNTIEYKVVSLMLRHLFTHIVVDIQPYGSPYSLNNPIKVLKPSQAPSSKVKTPVTTVNRVEKHRRRDSPTPNIVPPITLNSISSTLNQSTFSML